MKKFQQHPSVAVTQPQGTQNESTKRMAKHIRWTPEEMQALAEEARKLFPGVEKLTADNFLEAQNALPFERRREKINYTTVIKLRDLVKGKPGAKRKYARRTIATVATPVRDLEQPMKEPGALPPAPSFAVDDLARQISTAVITTTARSLRMAAERLEASAMTAVLIVCCCFLLGGCAWRMTNVGTYELEKDNIDRFDR